MHRSKQYVPDGFKLMEIQNLANPCHQADQYPVNTTDNAVNYCRTTSFLAKHHRQPGMGLESDQHVAPRQCLSGAARVKGTEYSLAFTSGGLYYQESLMVGGLYLEEGDWGLVRNRILGDNLLQARKLSSAKRSVREVLYRLQKLLPQELKYFSKADTGDQRFLLWLAICRHYQFIGDFAVNVIREKFLSLANTLDYTDFDQFFEQESRYHTELDSVTDSTRKKLRQVLFRILREAGLLTRDKQIIPATPGEQFIQVVTAADPAALRYLPMDPTNRKEVVA